MNRPSHDHYFMKIAEVVATRSTCKRRQVGAVLVRDNRIIATGYNGAPPGLPHCLDVGCEMEKGHCIRSLHAEHNAVLQVALMGGSSTNCSTLYSTASPCYGCFKVLLASKVDRVVAKDVYSRDVLKLWTKVGQSIKLDFIKRI